MPIQVDRLCRRIFEVGFLVVLAGESYGSAQADASAAAFKDGPVRGDRVYR